MHAALPTHVGSDVALKDAPLRSLFPDELPPPAPVRVLASRSRQLAGGRGSG